MPTARYMGLRGARRTAGDKYNRISNQQRRVSVVRSHGAPRTKTRQYENHYHNRGFGTDSRRTVRKGEADGGRHRRSAAQAHAYGQEGTQTDTGKPKQEKT